MESSEIFRKCRRINDHEFRASPAAAIKNSASPPPALHRCFDLRRSSTYYGDLTWAHCEIELAQQPLSAAFPLKNQLPLKIIQYRLGAQFNSHALKPELHKCAKMKVKVGQIISHN